MHTVARAITDHIRDPELMVNAFRAMFGQHSVEFYVEQRPKMAGADAADYAVIQRAMENGKNAFEGFTMHELGERHIWARLPDQPTGEHK